MNVNVVKSVEILINKRICFFADPNKGKFKALEIHHSLDMWHGAKNLSKKIAAVSSISYLHYCICTFM